MIVVDNVRKSFPTRHGIQPFIRHGGKVPRREVLHGISFRIERGELFGLLGPNGAGKTTLLKTLATLTIPDSGRVLIDGIDGAKNPLAAKRRIGLCTSEERSFYFRLPARKNLEFFGALVGLRGAALKKRIEEVVELVDLADVIDRRFDTYSSGMRQRLTVARALLPDPPILFLDEPTRAIDPVHSIQLRKLIREELVERRGKTVVLATNLLEEAWEMCDRLAILRSGNIAALGRPSELDASYARVLRYQFTLDRIDEELIERTSRIPGLTIISTAATTEGALLEVELEIAGAGVTELLRAVSSNGATVLGMRSEDPKPVDVFTDITQMNEADE
jgi:ABC-2 type transport system ATP-binding protein